MVKRNNEGWESALKKPGFHIVLDNDMFWVYPSPPPVEAEFQEDWSDSGWVVYERPDTSLLLELIETAGGSFENV